MVGQNAVVPSRSMLYILPSFAYTSSKANKNYLYFWVRSKEERFNVHSHLFSHNLAICMHIKKVISSDISRSANYYPPL